MKWSSAWLGVRGEVRGNEGSWRERCHEIAVGSLSRGLEQFRALTSQLNCHSRYYFVIGDLGTGSLSKMDSPLVSVQVGIGYGPGVDKCLGIGPRLTLPGLSQLDSLFKIAVTSIDL